MMTGKLISTTAPGKVFDTRNDLAQHYKSDWHKYNLKRREAGLPLLQEEEYQARLEAALALRQERESRNERSGKGHLKDKKKNKKTKQTNTDGAITVSQVPAYDKIKNEEKKEIKEDEVESELAHTQNSMEYMAIDKEEEPPIIDPRQCLFDNFVSPTLDANIERMQRIYGFFIPDQEFLIDKEGLLGYCQEKIKLGHVCLYSQKIFTTWQGCQKHMIDCGHTKLRYERGVDLEEFDPFYDFSRANAEFLGVSKSEATAENEDDDSEWEDVEDDDLMDEDDDDDSEGMYDGYKDEIARFGFDITPLGELIFPDGRIVGHRGLSRYYKQRILPSNERAAVVAARRAAGERLYQGRVYNVGRTDEHQSSLALVRGDTTMVSARGRNGKGVLVSSGGNGYTALSMYRYRAVVKKARRDDARGQRLQNKSLTLNINKMDKKANRLMNGVSVAHAAR